MSNYQRLISYIYTYEGGIRGKNIGFAKLESRGNQCRVTVNVKKIFVGGNPIGVYLLAGQDEIRIGTLFARNGAGDFRTVVSYSNVENSGYSLDECYGLSVHDVESTWRSYTTIWEDAVAHAAEVELAEITTEKVLKRKEATVKEQAVLQEGDGATEPLPISREIERQIEKEAIEEEPYFREDAAESEECSQTESLQAEVSDSGLSEEILSQSQEEMEDTGTNTSDMEHGDDELITEVDGGMEELSAEIEDEEQLLTKESVMSVSEPVEAECGPEPGTRRIQEISREPIRSPGTVVQMPEREKAQGSDVLPPEPERTPIRSSGTVMPMLGRESEHVTGMAPPSPDSERIRSSGMIPPVSGGQVNINGPLQVNGREKPGQLNQAGIPVPMPIRQMPTGQERNGRNHQRYGMQHRGMQTGLLREETLRQEAQEPAPNFHRGSSGMQTQMPNNRLINNRQVTHPAGKHIQGSSQLPRPDRNSIQGSWPATRTMGNNMPGPTSNMRPNTNNIQEEEGNTRFVSPELSEATQAPRPVSPGTENEMNETAPPTGFNVPYKDLNDTSPEQDVWEMMRKRYPKILAFDYADGCEVLTIKPQDIGLLPREEWIYGSNSFLLHGYYNYRYLILARLNNPEGKARYLLGVPGHYLSNEKYMASMFGFSNFVLAKKQPPKDGRFGYWYTDIKIGD